MRRYIIIGMIVAAAFAAGCKKAGETAQPKSPVVFATDVPEDAMLFNVKIDGIGTKSHFASDASTEDGEFAKLEWDEDDDIGVYALHMNEEGDDVDLTDVKCGLARIKSINPDGSATFYSTESDINWWMKEGDENDDSPYLFVAYYPARGEKHPFVLGAEFSEDDDEVERIYTPLFTVPVSQDGKSWADDQVLMDLEINTPYTRKGLIERTETVVFPTFKPITTLFQFRLMSGTGAAVGNIDKITLSLKVREKESHGGGSTSYWKDGVEVRVEWPEKYYYTTDYEEAEEMKAFVGLAGTGFLSLFLLGDPDNLGLIPLDASKVAENDEYVNPDLVISQSISMDFENPVSIPADIADAELYSLVVAPIMDGFFWSGSRNSAVLLFEAYSGDDVVLVAEKKIPTDGFKPGYRYNFNLAMGEYYDLTGTDAGSYSDVVPLEQ